MSLRLRLALLLALVLPATASRAQDVPVTGYQLNRYEPTPAGDLLFAVEHPWYSSTRYLAAGLTLDYTYNSLMYGRYLPSGQLQRDGSIIQNSFVGHVDVAGSLFDRVALSASLPITLFQSGAPFDPDGAGTYRLAPLDGVALGDPRVGLRVRLYGQPDRDPISLSIGGHVWIPIGVADKFTGDHSVRFLPRLIAGGVLGDVVRWSFNGGFYYRQPARLTARNEGAGNTVGSEVQLGLAVGVTNARRTLHVGPEALVAFHAAGAAPSLQSVTNAELLLAGSYLLFDQLQVGVGVGFGLAGDPGPPEFRALARVAWAPLRPPPVVAAPTDSDGDGINDDADACPRQKGVPTDDPRTHGCPPQIVIKTVPTDRDKDGVLDPDDICPDEPQGKVADPKRKGCPAGDRDKDGVFDHEDLCADTPQGDRPDPTRKGCPARDSDGDGVFDFEDQCPRLSAGLRPDPDKPGCPAPDRDGDSVSDKNDACPDRPGAPDPNPKKNGCPGLVTVRGNEIVILQQVFFATDKDVILPKSFKVLQSVAYVLVTNPVIKKVAVEGHTDNQGKRDHNMDLSQRRAESVRRFLAGKGVEEARLEAHGYGPDRPIADNKSTKGRAKNRRVVFQILDPAPTNPVPSETPVLQK